MKVQIAKFLLAIFLFSLSPFKEFVKAPLIIVHYYHHQQETPGIGIINFFELHYMQGIVHDNDIEQDMQLPFKSIDFNTSGLFVAQQNKDIGIIIPLNSYSYSPKINLFIHTNLPDAHLLGIFHPPQFS